MSKQRTPKSPTIDKMLEEIRRKIIVALFSDDELLDLLVLKGGNALDLAHKTLSRASVDVDFSIAGDFQDLNDARARIFAALRTEFEKSGYVLFDEEFGRRPVTTGQDTPDWWGGYQAGFKLATLADFEEYGHDLNALRRRCQVTSVAQNRTFKIDISKHEFCDGKVQVEMDDFVVSVYSLEMIAAEKLRAICQQMEAYGPTRHKKPRARDFYDIYQLSMTKGVELLDPQNRELVRLIFEAKQVPTALLAKIKDTRDFHAADWPSVKQSARGELKDFDVYFDFVVELASGLTFRTSQTAF